MYKPICYRAKTEEELTKVPEKLFEYLDMIAKYISKKYIKPKPIIITKDEDIEFRKSDICHICEYLITEEKVRDHCHITGKYRGPPHNKCNLNLKLPQNIPVFCHNSSNYDTHLFIKELAKKYGKIDLIANTDEKYINYTINSGFGYEFDNNKPRKFVKFSFVDTFRFMASSIEKLAKGLRKEDCKHIINYINNNEIFNDEEETFEILSGKGIFPYEFIDSLEKLEYSDELNYEDFYSSLNKENISKDDYNHYLKVWNKLKTKTLGDYSDLYNIQDVLLLADIFENFRSVCLTNYGLDPAHYLTAPSLAWDAMLKLTDVTLDLISDYDMYLMIEKGIRGGVSQCIKRYCKANNKYVKDYDPEKPENYILYVDANNLYGWALSQKLPYKGIVWLRPGVYTLKEWEETILELDENAEYGYILEVDLEYPKELHKIHKDFPFAPEHYNNKLCTTLLDKTDYVVHSRNLKYYLKQGLKLTKVSRVIAFDQDDYMKKYIEHNTNMRTKAKSDFEKDFFKLMNNSVFGKSMENVRNRCDIRLGNEEYSLKQAKKSNFKSFKIFDKDCIATHMIKTKVKFDKPIYIGFATLDLSKLLMYEFFYDKLNMYDPDLNLLYMDTDSFFVELKKDPYKIIKDNSKEFDTSDYNKDHECYNLTNKKVIGKFKDELNGIPLEEYCGLRSKLYSYTYANKNPVRCKGIKKSVVDKTIKMTDLKKCLFEDVEQFREMNCIRAYKHEVYTVSMNKLALRPKDDKRIICENKIDTVPYGY